MRVFVRLVAVYEILVLDERPRNVIPLSYLIILQSFRACPSRVHSGPSELSPIKKKKKKLLSTFVRARSVFDGTTSDRTCALRTRAATGAFGILRNLLFSILVCRRYSFHRTFVRHRQVHFIVDNEKRLKEVILNCAN